MIERLYVHNFRCFENLSIDLTGRGSTLVIGKNGTGKSTLRLALSVFQSICRGARVGKLIAGSDFTQQRKNIPMRFEADIKLANKRFKYALSLEMPEHFREARVKEELLSVDGEFIFSRQQAQVSQPGSSPFGLDWHVAALPVINARQALNDLIQQIKSYFASMILIAPIPTKMSGYSEEESFEVQDDAENLSSWLNALLLRYPRAYSVVFDYLKLVIPDLESFENVPRGEKGKQLLVKFQQQEHKGDLSLDFRHLSDGEKCIFLSALIVASNKVNGPVFCMWDEPDNHLSLPEVGHFITQLRKMTNTCGQLIATSHHSETIRNFSDDNTLVFTRTSHLEPTVVRPLSAIPYNGDLIEALVRDEVIG